MIFALTFFLERKFTSQALKILYKTQIVTIKIELPQSYTGYDVPKSTENFLWSVMADLQYKFYPLWHTAKLPGQLLLLYWSSKGQ